MLTNDSLWGAVMLLLDEHQRANMSINTEIRHQNEALKSALKYGPVHPCITIADINV